MAVAGLSARLVACGEGHTVVALSDGRWAPQPSPCITTTFGRLVAFGANGNGQLGLGHTGNTTKPEFVQQAPPSVVDWSSVALVEVVP